MGGSKRKQKEPASEPLLDEEVGEPEVERDAGESGSQRRRRSSGRSKRTGGSRGSRSRRRSDRDDGGDDGKEDAYNEYDDLDVWDEHDSIPLSQLEHIAPSEFEERVSIIGLVTGSLETFPQLMKAARHVKYLSITCDSPLDVKDITQLCDGIVAAGPLIELSLTLMLRSSEEISLVSEMLKRLKTLERLTLTPSLNSGMLSWLNSGLASLKSLKLFRLIGVSFTRSDIIAFADDVLPHLTKLDTLLMTLRRAEQRDLFFENGAKHLVSLRRINFWREDINLEVDIPLLSRLRYLRAEFSPRTWDMLAERPDVLSRLRYITLVAVPRNSVVAAWVGKALSKAKHLHYLDMSAMVADSGDCRALIENAHPALKHVRDLRLPEAMHDVAELSQLLAALAPDGKTRLRSLSLSMLETSDYEPFVKASPDLERLTLNRDYDQLGSSVTDLSCLASLSNLKRLQLYYTAMSDAVAIEFAQSTLPRLTKLTHFGASQNGIGCRGAVALAAGLHGARNTLRVLELEGNVLLDAGASAIVAAAAGMPELRRLSLADTLAGVRTAEQVSMLMHQRAQRKTVPPLNLDLSTNNFTLEHVKTMSRYGFRRLHTWNMGSNRLHKREASTESEEASYDDRGGFHMADGAALFTPSNMGNAGFCSILDHALCQLPVRQLNLTEELVSEDWLKPLVGRFSSRTQHLGQIRSLWLREGSLDDDGIKLFCRRWLPTLPHLTELDISGNPLGDDGLRLLLRHMTSATRLRQLNLGGVTLASSRLNFKALSRLHDLSLGGTSIRGDAISSLAQALPSMTSLRTLLLSNCELLPEAGIQLAEGIKAMRRLRLLNLNNNYLRDKGCKVILENLPESLVSLDLDSNEANWADVVDFFKRRNKATPLLVDIALMVPKSVSLRFDGRERRFSVSSMVAERNINQLVEVIENLPGIENLDISSLDLTVGMVDKLARAFRYMPDLLHLDLSNNELTGESITLLCELGFAYLGKLQVLDLDGNELNDRAVRTLARDALSKGYLPNLVSLMVDSAACGKNGGESLANALPFVPKLKRLSIGGSIDGARPMLLKLKQDKRRFTLLDIGTSSSLVVSLKKPSNDTMNLGRVTPYSLVQASSLNLRGLKSLAEHMLPALYQVRSLILDDCGLSDERVPHVVDALKATPELEDLSLRENAFTAIGMKLLASEGLDHVPRLRYLLVSKTECESDGFVTLATVGFAKIPKLQHLDLARNSVGNEGAAAVAQNLPSGLLSLDMTACSIRDEGAIELGKHLGRVNRLISLSLDRNAFNLPAMAAITRACNDNKLASLLRVTFDGCGDGSFDLESRRLRMVTYQLGDDGIEQLVSDVLPHTKSLRRLVVEDNGLTSKGCEVLAKGVTEHVPGLQAIDADSNRFGREGVMLLLRSISKWPQLTELHMNGTIGANGGIMLAESLTELRCNSLGSSISMLGDVMASMPELNIVSLSDNLLTDPAVAPLCKALRSSSGIQVLRLNNNLFEAQGVTDLVTCLTEPTWTRSLSEIHLQHAPVPAAKRRALEVAYRNTKTQVFMDPVRTVSFLSRWLTRFSLLNQVADLASDLLLLVLVICSCAFPSLGIDPVQSRLPFVNYIAAFALLCALLIGMVPFLRGPDQLLALVDGRSKSVFTYKLLALFEGSVELLVLYALRFRQEFALFDFLFIGLSILLLALDFSFVRNELYNQIRRPVGRRQAMVLLEAIWVAIVIVVALGTLSRYATHLYLLPYAMVAVALIIAAFVMMLLVAADEPNSEFTALGIVADGKYFAHPILAWVYRLTAAPLLLPLAWLFFKRRQYVSDKAVAARAAAQRGPVNMYSRMSFTPLTMLMFDPSEIDWDNDDDFFKDYYDDSSVTLLGTGKRHASPLRGLSPARNTSPHAGLHQRRGSKNSRGSGGGRRGSDGGTGSRKGSRSGSTNSRHEKTQ